MPLNPRMRKNIMFGFNLLVRGEKRDDVGSPGLEAVDSNYGLVQAASLVDNLLSLASLTNLNKNQ